MRLADFMEREGLNDEELAGKCQCDRVTINRVRRGVTKPGWPLMMALRLATGGKVTPNDFLETAK